MRSALRHGRDWQALAYLGAQPMLMAWQWRHGFEPLAYVACLFLAVGISVIHHNHAHLPMWRRRALNRATDLAVTLLQGHPTCVFHPTHNRNHHRHRHGPADAMRTWRFGDHNHLAGWALHPFEAVLAAYALVPRWLGDVRRRSPGAFRWYLSQYALWLLSWAVLLWIDPVKTLVFVILPQLFGLHWLLGANYLQHAHASETLRYGYARNFEGLVNPLLFNIGLHTAHHEHGRAHWSALTRLHAQYRSRIEPQLLEPSLPRYVLRVFLLGALFPKLRTRSLRVAHT